MHLGSSTWRALKTLARPLARDAPCLPGSRRASLDTRYVGRTRYFSGRSPSRHHLRHRHRHRSRRSGCPNFEWHLGARVAVEADAHHVAAALVEREIELRDEWEVHLEHALRRIGDTELAFAAPQLVAART